MVRMSRDAIYRLLLGCKDLPTARLVYSLMVSSRKESNPFLADYLIRLLAFCGSLEEVNQVFSKIVKPSVHTWSAVIYAHAKLGEYATAIKLYAEMLQKDIKPDKATFSCILKACGSIGNIGLGKEIHVDIIVCGLDSELTLGNTLVDMYSKCGCLENACKVFDKLPQPDAVSWGAMITACNLHGLGLSALELFDKMQQNGIKPGRVTFLCSLKACSSIGDINQGRLIHGQIVSTGVRLNDMVGNTLVDMYAKSGSLIEAHRVFMELPNRDVVSWGAMISGYVHNGDGLLALGLFQEMQQIGIEPNKVLYLSILKACASLDSIRPGRVMHDRIIRIGLHVDSSVGNALVDMYVKCGTLEEASSVFYNLPGRDSVSWGAMISGFAQHGDGSDALELFEQMQQQGIKPSKITFLCILKACSSIDAVDQIHEQIIRSGLDSDVAIGSSLVNMYAKCGSLEKACTVFSKLPTQNVVSWGTMIAGYAQQGHDVCVFKLFEKMLQEGIIPDKSVFIDTLKSCHRRGAIDEGMLIHSNIIKHGLESDVIIGSTILDMYTKFGSLEEARKVFDRMPNKNLVLWGAMISGYVQRGHGMFALELFSRMQQEGIKPSNVILSSVLKVCGIIGSTGQAKLIHDEIIRSGLNLDVTIGSTVIETYAKCGSLEDAHTVFKELPAHNIVSWGAMISGYARHGQCRLARCFFEDMKQQGLQPNHVIFTSILAACSHAGLLEEGVEYFKSMKQDHGIAPGIEQYSCVVDLLSRTGCLKEAEDLLQSMPLPPDFIVWTSLLSGCRTYCNVELGRKCFEGAVQSNPNVASGHVVMSNIYADAHLWDEVMLIQAVKYVTGVQKQAGETFIDVNNQVHQFTAGAKDHSQCNNLSYKLKRSSRFLKEEGYVPQLDLVLKLFFNHETKDLQCDDIVDQM